MESRFDQCLPASVCLCVFTSAAIDLIASRFVRSRQFAFNLFNRDDPKRLGLLYLLPPPLAHRHTVVLKTMCPVRCRCRPLSSVITEQTVVNNNLIIACTAHCLLCFACLPYFAMLLLR